MRNLPWEQAMDQARRAIDFRQYTAVNDLWVPKNLKQGDVVRCDLPTDFYKTGDFEIMPRNCLVLGVDLNAETLELETVRLVRFSYFTLDTDEKYELRLDPHDFTLRGKVTGFRAPVVLRTGRIEAVPADSEHFGFFMDRTGRIDSALFPLIKKHLQLGYDAVRQDRKVHVSENPTVFVAGLEADDIRRGFNFGLKDIGPTDIDRQGVDSREAVAAKAALYAPVKLLESALQRQCDKAQLSTQRRIRDQAQEALLSLSRELRRDARKLEEKEIRRLIDAAVKPLEAAASTDAQAESGDRLQDIPTLRSLLEKSFGLTDMAKNSAALKPAFERQAIDPNSLKDLETLGIGGLLRAPDVRVPDQLWRGRYLMMRIPSLGKPDEMSETTFRPCAVWRAYGKMDKEGNPVLAGFDLHPCTRDSAHLFKYKMGVRPLDTKVGKPSFLVADMMIRAPIDAEYFQPFQPATGNFYELLPHKIAEFEVKRRIAEERLGGLDIFGLQDVPKDWFEIELPDAPNERLRVKLQQWHRVRFDNTSKPAQVGPHPKARP